MPSPTQTTPPLPCNPDAERSLLGAILLDNTLYGVVAQKLTVDDFGLDNHRRIFKAIAALAEVQRPIDLITLCEQLAIQGDLDEPAVGGYAGISQLVDGVPRISHISHYADIVKGKATRRQLIWAAHTIQQNAFSTEQETEAIVEAAERAIAGIGERQATSELLPLKQVVDDNLEELGRLLTAERAISGVATGYAQLDGLLAGLHRGNVIILAARPSIGKTALALNIAENVAREGGHVALFSLEMNRREILQRLASSAGKLNLRQLRAGGMASDAWRQVTATLGKISQWPIYIDDANPITVTELAAKTRWIMRKHPISLVIVDYLQLVSAAKGRFANRNEEVGASSRALKAMARSLDVPVLVLSQLTRASEREERRPQLSDLRESGAIEQDADVVMFIHRPKAFAVGEPSSERNKGEVIVAKQRNGPTESVKFAFLAPFTRFEEMTPELFEGDQ